MKIILVMVMSADGKITAGENTNVQDWSSKEDLKYFSALIKKSSLIIMGRKTYETAKENMRLSKKNLRVIITGNPKKYEREKIENQLEFSNTPLAPLIKSLEKRGYKKGLLVGGAKTNASFIKANLINEMWLTVEPVILGKGRNLFLESPLMTSLKLLSSKKLNKKGTLLLKYDFFTI
ncbi:MAG: dihydrofolate reductase [Candidatus Taylorbacteria bacterium]|nr:dihydrofolate reductase [Candidatus Taylorbacteria bacterium]